MLHCQLVIAAVIALAALCSPVDAQIKATTSVKKAKVTISKKVVNLTAGSVAGLTFSINANCSPTSSPATVSLADGGSNSIMVPSGSTCSPSEATLPSLPSNGAGYCNPGQNPEWTQQTLPSGPILITTSKKPVKFTIINTLKCVNAAAATGATGSVAIKKTCDKPTLIPGQSMRYRSACKVTVTTTGPVQVPLAFTETLATAGTTVFNGSTPAGWTCNPGSAAGSAPMNCTIPNTLVNPASNSWAIDFVVDFPTAAIAHASENCVDISGNGVSLDKACHPFSDRPAAPPSLSATKSCKLVQQYVANNPTGVYDCTITVTATGAPLPPVISLTEAVQLTGGALGNVFNITSSDPWTCTAAGCSIPGTSFPASGTSTLHAQTLFHSAGPASGMQNCVTVNGLTQSQSPLVPAVSSGQVCAPVGPPAVTTPPYSLGVEKTCVPFSIPFIAVGTMYSMPYAPQWWDADAPTEVIYFCKIKVTASGSLPPTITVSDTLQSALPNAGQALQLLGIGPNTIMNPPGPPGPWVCPPYTTPFQPNAPISCSIAGASFPGSGISELISAVKIVQPATGAPIENCASVSGGSSPAVTAGPSCVTLDPPPLPGAKLTVNKTVLFNGQPFTMPNGSGPGFGLQMTCGQQVASFMLFANGGLTLKNIPPGTSCTVVETASSASGLCPAGQVGSWIPSYSPSDTVVVPATGAAITVTNELKCEPAPPEYGSVIIQKYLLDFASGMALSPLQSQGLSFPMTLTCGNVVRTFSMQGNSQHTESGLLTSDGCIIQEGAIPPPPASLCPAGLTSSWDTSYWNTGPVNPVLNLSASPQQPILYVRNRVQCLPPAQAGTGKLMVEKWALHNGQILSSQPFAFDVKCGGNATTVSVPSNISGQTALATNIPAGTSCTVAEQAAAVPQNLCPAGETGSWTTSYIPGNQVTLNAGTSSTSITVTNVLTCVSKLKTNSASCDSTTAIARDGACACKFRNMQAVSGTACECAKGFTLSAGKGCVKAKAETSKPKDPVCGKNQRLVSRKCVDSPPPPPPPCGAKERRNAAGKCVTVIPDCPRGAKWNGKRCVDVIPDCPRGAKWNGKRCVAEVPDCPQGTKWNGKRCVPQAVECKPGQIRIGRRCLDKPRCPRGQIAMPGTGLCVKIGGDRPRKPRPDAPDRPPEDGDCVPTATRPCD